MAPRIVCLVWELSSHHISVEPPRRTTVVSCSPHRLLIGSTVQALPHNAFATTIDSSYFYFLFCTYFGFLCRRKSYECPSIVRHGTSINGASIHLCRLEWTSSLADSHCVCADLMPTRRRIMWSCEGAFVSERSYLNDCCNYSLALSTYLPAVRFVHLSVRFAFLVGLFPHWGMKIRRASKSIQIRHVNKSPEGGTQKHTNGDLVIVCWMISLWQTAIELTDWRLLGVGISMCRKWPDLKSS